MHSTVLIYAIIKKITKRNEANTSRYCQVCVSTALMRTDLIRKKKLLKRLSSVFYGKPNENIIEFKQLFLKR